METNMNITQTKNDLKRTLESAAHALREQSRRLGEANRGTLAATFYAKFERVTI